MRGNTWLAEKLLASQEGPRSIKLVINPESMSDLTNTQCGYVDALSVVPNTAVYCGQLSLSNTDCKMPATFPSPVAAQYIT